MASVEVLHASGQFRVPREELRRYRFPSLRKVVQMAGQFWTRLAAALECGKYHHLERPVYLPSLQVQAVLQVRIHTPSVHSLLPAQV